MVDIDLSSAALVPSSTGFMITGDNTGDYLGLSVGTAGDVNNDGYDDIIVNAPFKDSQQGRVYVIYGGPKSSLSDITTPSTTLVAASTGFYIVGANTGDYFGQVARSAGDLNKDGYADIIIGAPYYNSYQGAAYVIYGRTTSSMTNIDLASTALSPASTGFMILGEAAGAYLGWSASGAGDMNGDGYSDVIVGAWNINTLKGTTYVVYGGETSSMSDLDLATVTLDPASTGFTITGDDGDGFGYSVNTAGDVNKDGYDDIIIGSPFENSQQGVAYVIHTGSF